MRYQQQPPGGSASPRLSRSRPTSTVEAGSQKAVQRVRHVFHEIRKAFPDQEAVVTAALEFIHPFFSSCADNIELWLDPLNVRPPVSELATGSPMPRSFSESLLHVLMENSKLFAAPRDSFYSQKFSRRLSGPESTRVMRIFNCFGPLLPEDVDFLRPILAYVTQAAAQGVWDVMGDKRQAELTRLPEIGELGEPRHVYVYDCKGDQHYEDD
ncbi:hypothetical protein OEA41_002784 [Lepraria neglecta]|uniref:Uncharacterized protein n=1 Tax=Lepraria neglecta TaxID=209136 RepID=A0AAD9Z5V3_9LECA|nr:hypothetical protein OEA41_002784 [Lepraria neglecta]